MTKEVHATLLLLTIMPKDAPIVLLTGTPAWTSTFDVYNQVDILRPGFLGNSKWSLALGFMNVLREHVPGKAFMKLTIGRCERPVELNVILTRTVMLRRRRHEVLASLPQLQLVDVPLEVSSENVSSVISEFGIRRADDGSWEGVVTAWERVGLCKGRAAIEFLKEKLNVAVE